ncbi:hypothetical protein Zmor_003976 [Zophobas morio]|jgi:hypothetical protein|uniref:Uncharacterized protein n=1 Tax=Zophobas morio TaxID=2755281 RepID=A0AA38HLX7_9CUCU|nr:hypothetical protein Zmor_003976 [Zophobas morio]
MVSISCHLANDPHLIKNIKLTSEPVPGWSGCNKAVGEGSLHSGKVLLIPNLKTSIISVGKISDNNNVIVFEDKQAMIIKRVVSLDQLLVSYCHSNARRNVLLELWENGNGKV